jgi:hypothetical protein
MYRGSSRPVSAATASYFRSRSAILDRAFQVAIVACLLTSCRRGTVQATAEATAARASSNAGTVTDVPPRPSASVSPKPPPASAGCNDPRFAAVLAGAPAIKLQATEGILATLIKQSDGGRPQRITFQAHTSRLVDCECPFFVHVLDFDPPVMPGASLSFHPAYQNHSGDAVVWDVIGAYTITGYYSGRLINYYQWYNENALKPGKRPMTGSEGDDEQRFYWPQKEPEFCLESWCFRPNPAWKSYGPRAEGHPAALAHLRNHGGKLCP